MKVVIEASIALPSVLLGASENRYYKNVAESIAQALRFHHVPREQRRVPRLPHRGTRGH
ncbi:Uncharacterised protein [Mycobacteroides abscessus subsp. bolletii]|uniref:hypothetical protein n=1 Tax=Mycobacteroides abscessus TaxID=36809 RepID=UPI0009D0E701|nr:hypothetical protein [Mycobacteroides abscessus]SKX80599.1 Uncharacterised protein [Mycobacteroides abscessus subsp. bolletii]